MAFIWGGVLWDWTGLEFGFSSKEGQIWPNFEQVLVWIILLVLCVRGTVFFFRLFPKESTVVWGFTIHGTAFFKLREIYAHCFCTLSSSFVVFFFQNWIHPSSHCIEPCLRVLISSIGSWNLMAWPLCKPLYKFSLPHVPPPNTNSNPLALLDWHSAISFAQ